MTKAVLCTHCFDILAPYRDWETDRRWRWCQCDHAATRWRDGARGLLEVTALHGPDHLRVIGLNNGFLTQAVEYGAGWSPERWRVLHSVETAAIPPHYLFHANNRACWALVIRVGESGDVHWMPYEPAKRESLPPPDS